MNTEPPSVTSKRFKLEVSIESEDLLTLEYVRAIAATILELNDSIVSVKIFNRDYRAPQSK